jgi:hypothetical protein
MGMAEEWVLEIKTEESSAEEINECVRDEAAGRDGGAILTKSGKGTFLRRLHLAKDV